MTESINAFTSASRQLAGLGGLNNVGASKGIDTTTEVKNDKGLTLSSQSGTQGVGTGTQVELDPPATMAPGETEMQVGFILDSVGNENSAMLVLYQLMVLLQEAMRQQRESMQTARQAEYNLSAAATQRQADDIMDAAKFSLGLGITSCILQGVSAAISIGGAVKSLSLAKGAPALDQKLSTARQEMSGLRNELKTVSHPQQQATSAPLDTPDLQAPQQQPATATTTEPTATAPQQQPTTAPAAEPTATAPTAEPAATTPTAEPAATTPTAEPVATAPTATAPTAEPATTAPTAEPAAAPAAEQPAAAPRTRGEVIDDIEAKQVEIDSLKADRDAISDQLNNTQINTRAFSEGLSAVAGFMKAGSDYTEAMGQAQAKLDEADATRMEQQAAATGDLVRSVVDLLTAMLDILKGVQQSEHETNQNIMQGI